MEISKNELKERIKNENDLFFRTLERMRFAGMENNRMGEFMNSILSHNHYEENEKPLYVNPVYEEVAKCLIDYCETEFDMKPEESWEIDIRGGVYSGFSIRSIVSSVEKEISDLRGPESRPPLS